MLSHFPLISPLHRAAPVLCCPANDDRVNENTRRPCSFEKSRLRPSAIAFVVINEYELKYYAKNASAITRARTLLTHSKSIKIGIDEVGTFFIKKQILDNNIFKYINILEYKSANNTNNNTSNSRWNSQSQSIFNESIITRNKSEDLYRNFFVQSAKEDVHALIA